MTRQDAIFHLRQQLPRLRTRGITGVSLVGDSARGAADELEILLDIDLDAHPEFDLIALAAVQRHLEGELRVPVHAFVEQGMRSDARERLVRDAVPIL